MSYRDVEELLAERGIAVSDETVRRWCEKFGQPFADGVRRRRARPGDKWHLDKVQLKIKGRKHWLWRAENSHRPTRRRERALQRFKSPEHAQQFLVLWDGKKPRGQRPSLSGMVWACWNCLGWCSAPCAWRAAAGAP